MANKLYNILDTFSVLKPDLGAEPVQVGPSLYADIERDFNGFAGHTLVSVHEFDAPWETWERHPAGDEIVMLLSGQVTLVLRTGTGEDTVSLQTAGDYVIVPRNTWHTARTTLPTRMLFITPGEGTENQAQ